MNSRIAEFTNQARTEKDNIASVGSTVRSAPRGVSQSWPQYEWSFVRV